MPRLDLQGKRPSSGAFLARSAKNRAFRDSAIAPAPVLRAVAASHPSNPLRERQLKTRFRNCHGNSGTANCLWQLAARNQAVAILF
jgi:hypothetical protein